MATVAVIGGYSMTGLRMLAPRVAAIDTRTARPAPKVADPYYLTPEHRAWAAEGARLAGGRCQDPNCATRGRTHGRLFADHIIELKDGGAPLAPENRMMRCGACHARKTAAARAARMARR